MVSHPRGNRRIRTALAFCLLGLAGCQPPSNAPAAGNTKQKLQGTWRVVAARYDGAQVETGIGNRYVFRDETLTELALIDGELLPIGKYTVHYQSGRSPAQFDTVGFGSGERRLFIYRFNGDQLQLCKEGNETRPTSFAAEPGDDQLLLELERVPDAAPADAPPDVDGANRSEPVNQAEARAGDTGAGDP